MSKKEYITYMTNVEKENQLDYLFLQDCMDEILGYSTKRFAFLKKINKLGLYDKACKDNCDEYRNAHTFTNHKNKKETILDARYARAIDISIQARCASLIETQQLDIETKFVKRKKILSKYKKEQKIYHEAFQKESIDRKKINKTNRDKRHEKVSYLLNQITKINNEIIVLENKLQDNLFENIVFGGKYLFKKQHKSGVNFELWKKEWHNRASEIECGGSASEDFGNKQFQLTLSNDQFKDTKQRFNLKVNVPNRLREKYGDKYTLKNIVFPRGEKAILKNVLAHQAYRIALSNYNKNIRTIDKNEDLNDKEKALKFSEFKKPKHVDFGCTTVSFLIKKKKNGKIGIHVTLPRDDVKIISNDEKGVIGVNINHENISMAEIDKEGKLLYSKVFRFNFGHKNSGGYREALINKSIKEIVDYAKSKKKHIVLESLDFFNKKANQLKGLDKNYNRMLHTLAYAKIKERFRINCFLSGVKLIFKYAAYSSFLGKILYAKKLGISVHQAAAYVMARRYYKFDEHFRRREISIIYKEQNCQLIIPEDIFKTQYKGKDATKFWAKTYTWLQNELKAPSRFYNEGEKPLTSLIYQRVITTSQNVVV